MPAFVSPTDTQFETATAVSAQDEHVRTIFGILEGEREADLLLRNLNILDVHTESVYPGSLLVHGQRIIALNPDESIVRFRESFDGEGLYAIPGLIDAHLHFESQLAHPAAFGEAIVPSGTTTVFGETLDFASAAGDEAVDAAKALFTDHERLPYRLYAFAPGKKTSTEVTEAMLGMDPVIGLGELAHLSYMTGNADDFRKSALGRANAGVVNCHWGVTALSDTLLNYMPAIGVDNNHDVWNEDDIEKSVRYGLNTQIKFGVGSPEVIRTMLRAIVKRRWPAENFQLCADNISVDRVLRLGHIDWVISLAIEMGMPPIQAIKMGTLYTARSFHKDRDLGSLSPGRFADIVLTDSLSKINPRYVFKGGQLVAKDRKLIEAVGIDYSALAKRPRPGLAGLRAEQLELAPIEVSADGAQAKVLLFDVYGRGHLKFAQEIWVPLRDGVVVPEYEGVRLNRISVVQRYADGERHIVNGLFKGVSIEDGAVSTFWPAPSAYFVVVGTDSVEMRDNLAELDALVGGCVVTAGGEVKAVLPLDFYGVMADMNLTQLVDATRAIDDALAKLGNRNEGEPVVNKLLTLFISLDRFGFMK
ncbi:amidohydrolase family protein [Nocardia yamanashiensis]|uniref:adenine deaminase C-terminal domain-containing protein n=1 Tax=Nocardia yamanashiensis TaxID=209247 RepID=UPI001E346FB7|nr:adenine deaminase C-terminal domain-containing protein [Nocardia yamanashiensis]UGT43173.1 amidohydrolase family protein [Nocardia yamanashiensis]